MTLPLQTVFSCMFAQAQLQSACPPLDPVWTQGGHYTIVGKGGQSQLYCTSLGLPRGHFQPGLHPQTG